MTAAARDTALSLFNHALRAVHGSVLVHDALAGVDSECAVVALGKAAGAMMDGALGLPGLELSRGFIAVPRGYAQVAAPAGWQVHYGGHPIPDRGSLAAGRALVAWLADLPPTLPLLVLMSGGSSACIEHLREGIELEEVAARTERLLAAGADIRRLNAARSEWSLLKQGRALKLAGTREVHVYVLADVPGDDPALVGSGPFWSSALGSRLRILAANADALDAVAEAGCVRGLRVRERGQLTGDAARVGTDIARMLAVADRGLYLWGGETTVALPERPGRGGRCQHLALAAAIALDGDRRVTLLAAGTDGIDGHSTDAGGVIDGGSAQRIRDGGVDPLDALNRADANRALAASGDLINTGPTGTNVMDVVIAIVE